MTTYQIKKRLEKLRANLFTSSMDTISNELTRVISLIEKEEEKK